MLFKPLIVVLNGTANAVLRMIGVEPQEELRSARSAVELRLAGPPIGRAGHPGEADRGPARPLDLVLRQDRRRRAHPAGAGAGSSRPPTPRTPCIAAAAETGHSRFPVSGEDSDDVVGLVHLKRAVAIPPDERPSVLVEQLIVPVPIVPGLDAAGRPARPAPRTRPADGRRRRRVRRHRRHPHPRGRRRGAGRRDQGRARPGGRPRRVPARRHLAAARHRCGRTRSPRSPACTCRNPAPTRPSPGC